ncbi:MAG: hypothetical protein ACO1QS_18925, partial [Verrucomicrobiota bacterium]
MNVELNKGSSTGGAGTNLGLGCLILFALPFAIMGTGALIGGILKLKAGQMKDGSVLCLIGTVFALVGFGMIIGSVYGMRHEKARAKRKAEHPNEPWRWREDWAQGRANSQGKSGA